MGETLCEYAIRVTEARGQYTYAATTHLPSARELYDQQRERHGADAVELLTWRVHRSEWVPSVLQPRVPDQNGVPLAQVEGRRRPANEGRTC